MPFVKIGEGWTVILVKREIKSLSQNTQMSTKVLFTFSPDSTHLSLAILAW